jgi:hypothetical protein
MNTQIFANRMVSRTVNLSQFPLLIIALLGVHLLGHDQSEHTFSCF